MRALGTGGHGPTAAGAIRSRGTVDTKCRSVLLLGALVIVVWFTPATEAKGPVVKLVVSGPDLAGPVEVTEDDAIAVSVYGGNFVDRERGPQHRASGLKGAHQVQFHVEVPREGVQMRYVVYFVWDSSEHRGLVYFPGPGDAWYLHNVRTVALPTAGQWFFATETWSRAVRRAIPGPDA